MKIKEVLTKQLEFSKPSKEVFDKINKISKDFVYELKKKLKSKKIKAEVFIGGSLAKKTLVKKGAYDTDVFVRFDEKYSDEKLSLILGRVLGSGKGIKKVHGSRDYYQLFIDDVLIEVVPVLKISKPSEAINVTDLSFFHVKYVLKKLRKNKKLTDEIILAKAFAHAQGVYGAESYIHGFSGYALELLIIYYGSFLKFIQEISYANINKKNRIIIDSEKFYKNKNEVLMNLNEAKINSPVVLVDPTFKERNASSSLSYETLDKFKKSCNEFLKNPSLKFFEKKDISLEFKKFLDKLKIVEVKTKYQAGDIAGTKSKKFYEFFLYKLKREFEIKKSGFDYDEDVNTAKFYLALDKKKNEIVRGPPATSVHNLLGFKKAHPNAFIKNGFAYASLKHDLGFEKWFSVFLSNGKRIIGEMGIIEIKEI